MEPVQQLEYIESLIANFRDYYKAYNNKFPDDHLPIMQEGEALCNTLLDEIDRVKHDE